MTAIKKLVVEFEEKNLLHIMNKQSAYKDFLIVFSFFCGAALHNVGNDFPFVFIFLIVIGIIFSILLKYFFDKEISASLSPWLKAKCDFIENEIKYSKELEKFKELNPTYSAYEDLNVYLIKVAPRNLSANQLIDVNKYIKNAYPHLSPITVKEENDFSISDDDDENFSYSSDVNIEEKEIENVASTNSTSLTTSFEDDGNIDITSINAKSFLNLSIEYLNNSLKYCKITSQKNQLKLLLQKVKSVSNKDFIADNEFYSVYKEIVNFKNDIDPYESEILWTQLATALVILDAVRDETFEFTNEIKVFMDTCETLTKKKK
jgi:hypothetical protein